MANPPKPSHLHAVQGTARKDRKNPNEPQLEPGSPPCPEDLTTDQKVLWGRYCQELGLMGVLTRADAFALRDLVAKTDEVYKLRKILDAEGYLITVTTTQKEQVKKAHPAVEMLHRAETELRLQQTRFGLDPSARTKVHTVAPPRGKQDEQQAPVRPASAYFTR